MGSQQRFDRMLERLLAFRLRHGHCRVARRWPEDPELGKWVAQQRSQEALGELSEARRERLDAAGFSWHPWDERWNANFELPRAFKAGTGTPTSRIPAARTRCWPAKAQARGDGQGSGRCARWGSDSSRLRGGA